MINLLKKRTKRNQKNAAFSKPASVDISRVIPGASPSTPTAATTLQPVTDDAQPQVDLTDDHAVELSDDAIAAKYKGWMLRDLTRLINSWAAVQNDFNNTTHLKALLIAAHDLAGMGVTYGYPSISKLANTLETLLKSGVWRQNGELVDLHIAACRAAAQTEPETDGEIDAISSNVCDALEERVHRLTFGQRLAS